MACHRSPALIGFAPPVVLSPGETSLTRFDIVVSNDLFGGSIPKSMCVLAVLILYFMFVAVFHLF